MQKGRIIFTSKCLGSLIKQHCCTYDAQLRHTKLLFPINPARQLLSARTSHALSQKSDVSKYEDLTELDIKHTWLTRILSKILFINPNKYRRIYYGTVIYEQTVDTLNYDSFFKTFELPDTFISWFVITELHLWMIMVRLMAIPQTGQTIRNHVVEAMWRDVDQRANKLGAMLPSVKRKSLIQISQQFNATVIDYDEGMMSDDKALAAALWRGFFNSSTNNPLHVEKLVKYVRKQLVQLDEMGTVKFVKTGKVKWIDINTI